MPRRPRIELAGYHHVYNRAVERKYILQNYKDKDKFLEIVNETAHKYKLVVHSYCIMDNHYHLLVENKLENLSLAMRQINSKYASYYNKKYKRVGHLWQDGFKSWYVLDEDYLYILFKYIESNPVKVNMTKRIGQYPYSSSFTMLNNNLLSCCKKSFVLENFSVKELAMYLSIPISEREVKSIEKLHKEKFKIEDNLVQKEKIKTLNEYFKNVNTKDERDKFIIEAFNDGYKQSEISKYLGLSSSTISKIIKSGNS
ncbi:transposase [Arcobacter roscoffensis]|uniref:Transposase n=1 Tax=Arcobacter roscoffensis TaxID=2961520 RepID=A0ABY5E420_9BACT|nr:transposase [Arcobacter roscoffensis]UTJ05486.1 transposase [Arcobacter roscoffensis]